VQRHALGGNQGKGQLEDRQLAPGGLIHGADDMDTRPLAQAGECRR
jgi:hypothetical protein